MPRRVTQRDIARMTGVSQTLVSFVLNGRDDPRLKIAPETRERVRLAIEATGYVADPVARRLAEGRNRILGVFTYEPVFPSSARDFYHPFLVGIERRAEELDIDLLLLTSGRRQILQRLRLADGCILLGRELDRAELTTLVRSGPPFVSIGRRDDAGGPVPYVGADYVTATADVVRRAVALGHTRLAYLGAGEGAEAWTDRWRGFELGICGSGATARRLPALEAVRSTTATAVVCEEAADGPAVHALRPDLSIITLGEPTRAVPPSKLAFTGIEIPREAMGEQAVDVLTALLEGRQVRSQRLLPCSFAEGETLRPA
ncbi:LacI family DNA-binding transcriptional regulator [Dactylosporangium sp. NPDC000244]|uniref:LacI family DNA-binding transcriptional regulator n=1 Tax=Dactylosporangium sp. NPDC000244 TaxID=3154365 RepID=UPI003321DB59